jgi:YHS domain-containing protein
MQDTSTSGKKHGKAAPKHSAELPLLIDPVCGMDLEESADAAGEDPEKAEHNGTTYYFCSEECRKQFESNPQQFAG